MAQQHLVNGVDVQELGKKAKALKAQPELAQFKFRVTNKWDTCGHNVTTVGQFYGVEQENQHKQTMQLEADEPPTLLGTDRGPNPVEHLLNALVSCLTTSMVYHAAVRGIRIEELESTVEGDLDLRGFMGLEPDVKKGYKNIRVTFHVKSDAPDEALLECARFSPVYDVSVNATNVELRVEKR